eukprot:jgi/Chlat1/5414/Chrsp35S00403
MAAVARAAGEMAGVARVVRVVGVVGAGQMGSGIAQVAASSSHDVILSDVSASALDRGRQGIASSLTRFVKKGTITQASIWTSEAADVTLARIKLTTSLSDMAAADIVIEAVSESEGLKRKIFTELDEVLGPSAILASNTSSISITRLGAATKRPQSVIGMHWMNPPPIMQLIEIVRGLATSDEVFATTKAFAEAMGKTTCTAKDYPGFIVNRILMPMINEAFFALHEGVATPSDIDLGMKLGTNQPMGPLALADMIGLDTCLAIMRVLHQGLGDDKYRPCPLLVLYVDAGRLGKKSGSGVYEYEASRL